MTSSTFLLKSFWQDFNMLLEKCGYVLLDKSLITHEIDNYREFLTVCRKNGDERRKERNSLFRRKVGVL